jgi:putative hydrolase of the HAD superfamily
MTVDAVVFDWGGTLTPWHDIDLVEQWAAYAITYDPTDERLASRLADAEVLLWRDQQGSRGANGTGTLDHVFQACGVNTGSERHGLALAAYLEAWDPHTLADPDARDVLAALRADGIRVGILSNTLWPRWHHEAVFSRDGLTPHIDAAVYSSELPVAKPHRAAFEAAVDAVGSVMEHTVFVGDRPWDDIHGAQQVGMRAILIPHSRLGDQAVDIAVTPDAVAERLADVVSIVLGWRSGSETR